MRIYATGTNGMIGRRLAKFLLLTPIPRNRDINLTGADVVIHFGAYGNNSWQHDLKETFDANVLGTFTLLEKCRLEGVKKFIFIGSSSEYGKKNKTMREDMTLDTDTMYGCSKVCGTYLTRHYSKYFKTAVVRPFSIYGEEEDERKFIPTVVRCIKNTESMPLSDGTHDWVYVDDFCRALVKIIDCDFSGIINVGTGVTTSNQEVVKLLEDIAGKKVKTRKAPSDRFLWVADNSKIKSLGWKPEVLLREGLKRVYEAKNT